MHQAMLGDVVVDFRAVPVAPAGQCGNACVVRYERGLHSTLPCIDLLLLSSSSGDVRTFAWSNLLINSSKQRVDRWRIGWLDGRSDSGISLSVCLLFASKDLVNGADETMTDVTAGGAGGEFGIEPV